MTPVITPLGWDCVAGSSPVLVEKKEISSLATIELHMNTVMVPSFIVEAYAVFG